LAGCRSGTIVGHRRRAGPVRRGGNCRGARRTCGGVPGDARADQSLCWPGGVDLRVRGRRDRRYRLAVGHADWRNRARHRAMRRRRPLAAGLPACRTPRLPDLARRKVLFRRFDSSDLAAPSLEVEFNMNDAREFAVERWSRTERQAAVGAAVVLALLALAPLVGAAQLLDKLTTLFVYVLLAAMWNLLSG